MSDYMNGIPVTRLSGIDANTEYKVTGMDGIYGRGHNYPKAYPQHYNQYRKHSGIPRIGGEFAGLGCSCDNALNGLGACSDTANLVKLNAEFEQRVKNHLINTYNYIVANRHRCGVKNPDAVAAAYKKIIDNWADPRLREIAMTEAENLLANDKEIAIATAAYLAKTGGLTNLSLTQTTSGQNVKMRARRRGTVAGLGEVDIEILPENTQVSGIGIAGFGGLGNLGDIDTSHVSFAGGLELADDTELSGDDGSATEYILQGINGLGKKVAVKIKPKNPITKLKQATKAVKKEVKKVSQTAQTKVKVATKKAADTAKKVVKKASKVVVKYNPLTVAARNGFLLAIKLNIKNIANKLKWGYANQAQASKVGFSVQDLTTSRANLLLVEKVFVKVGGDKNALRNAVLNSKKGKLNGLGAIDPVTLTAITAAIPLILEVVKLLQSSKVAGNNGPQLDPNGDGGEPLPSSTTPVPSNDTEPVYNPNTGPVTVNIDRSNDHEIYTTSDGNYTNTRESDLTNGNAPGNRVLTPTNDSEVFVPTADNLPPDAMPVDAPTADTPQPESKKAGAGIVVGVLAVGVLLATSAGKNKKSSGGLKGTENSKNRGGRPRNTVEKFNID